MVSGIACYHSSQNILSSRLLNLGVCILLRVLDQVQRFPSNATLIQLVVYCFIKILIKCVYMLQVLMTTSTPAQCSSVVGFLCAVLCS
jgi:hypothetical protein